jgi:hypothetical protein
VDNPFLSEQIPSDEFEDTGVRAFSFTLGEEAQAASSGAKLGVIVVF